MRDFVYASNDGTTGDLSDLASAPLLAFDTEGTGVSIGTSMPLGFSLAYRDTGAYYVDIRNEFFKYLLADEKRPKLAYNAKFDRSMMKKVGVRIDNLCDPMIAAHLLEWESLSLESQAAIYCGVQVPTFKELGKPIHTLSLGEAAQYSCPHSAILFPLWQTLEGKMKKLRLLDVFWNLEMPLVPVLSDMELDGVRIDLDRFKELELYFDGKLDGMTDDLNRLSGVPNMNHNSPDQVADLLFKKLKLPPTRTTGTGKRPGVGADLLEKMKKSHPYIPIYLDYKELRKLKSTYITSLVEKAVDGRLHGSFNQTRTRTGRLSSSDPNLQNIPQRKEEGKKIRTGFVAREGYVLMKADFDLMELKGLAHFSGDPVMLSAFLEGRDIHTETAIKVFGDKKHRGKAKTLDFQIVYGGGEYRLRKMFFEAYVRAGQWIKEAQREASESLYVRTLYGRIRTLSGFESTYPKDREHAAREAVSTIIQGSMAEIVKVGMRKLWEKIRDTSVRMLLQVHDEIVLEVPKDLVMDVAKVVRDALTYKELSLPFTITISVGPNWGQMEKLSGY